MFKNLVVVFCYIVFLLGQSCVFSVQNLENEAFLQIYPTEDVFFQNPYISDAFEFNTQFKIFNKNLKNYKRFVLDNSQIPSSYYARFILPDIAENLNLKKNKQEREVFISQVVKNIYLNILKNEKMMIIQKEQISLKKEMLDNAKMGGELRDIMIKNTEYIEAQNEYLEYKKSYNNCIKQLSFWTNKDYEPAKSLDDFDIQAFYNKKAQEYILNNEKNKAFELKQKYFVVQNLSKNFESSKFKATSLEKKDMACDFQKQRDFAKAEFLNFYW